LNQLAPNSNNLSHTYLTATVGAPMSEGQVRAGFAERGTVDPE